MIQATEHAVTFCPYWSGTPYEILVVPASMVLTPPGSHRQHRRRRASRRSALRAVNESVGDVAYNVVFHSAPYSSTGEFHWHVHILPCLTTRAGFELGTGVMINVVGPEKAAQTCARR